MNLENFDKLDIIVNATKKCAELLKDPTLNGKRQLEAQQRNEIRECSTSSMSISGAPRPFLDFKS